MAEEFSIICRVSVSPQEMKISCDANDQFNLRPTLSRGRLLKTGLMEQNSSYDSFKLIFPFLMGQNHTHNLPLPAAVDQIWKQFCHIERMTLEVQPAADD